MKQNYIERYIYAATRHLPGRIQGDVKRELDALIADMLSQRCGEAAPTEEDVRLVLTELGPPDELAAKYMGEERNALISGRYFLGYKRMLMLVLPIAAAGIALARILSFFLGGEGGESVFVLLLEILGQSIGGTIAAFAVITIIFAAFERYRVDFYDGDFLWNLPVLVPEEKAKIKPFEPIFEMVFSVLAVVVLIGFPQLLSLYSAETGWVPILNIAFIRSVWFLIVLWAVLTLLKESMKLVMGRYTKRLALVTGFANAITIVTLAIVLLNEAFLNPGFIRAVEDFVAREFDGFFVWLTSLTPVWYSTIGPVILAITIVTLAAELISTTLKAIKYDKAQGMEF